MSKIEGTKIERTEVQQSLDLAQQLARSRFLEDLGGSSSLKFAREVYRLISGLPERCKDFLKCERIKVIPVDELPEVDGLPGNNRTALYIHTDRTILISQRGTDTKLALYHEIAHSIDHCSHPGWISSGSAYSAAFQQDFESMKPLVRNLALAEFGIGNIHRLKKEIFAEILSHQMCPEARPATKHFFLTNFPRTAKLIEHQLAQMYPHDVENLSTER